MATDVTIEATNHPIRNSVPSGALHAPAPIPTRRRRAPTGTAEAGNCETVAAPRRNTLQLNLTVVPAARGETLERTHRSGKKPMKLYVLDRQDAASHADLENITQPDANTEHPRRISDRIWAHVLGCSIEAHGGTIQSGARPGWRDEGAHASMRFLRQVMI